MIKVIYGEFYITNVCNINCENCNRFNNFNFTGAYDFETHADVYEQWSRVIDFNRLSILGGEPLLHPNLASWARGIRRLWPNAELDMSSNGTTLNKARGLYELLKETKITLNVCVHNYDWTEDIKNSVMDFLTGPVTRFSPEDHQGFFTEIFTDANGVKIRVIKFNAFHQSTIKRNGNQLTLHNSDAEKAHQLCDMKHCHTFLNGRLYKCGVAAVLPEFMNQFTVDISDEDRAVLDTGFTVEQGADGEQLMRYLKSPMPMCKFCPDSYEYNDLAAQIGKTKLPKKL